MTINAPNNLPNITKKILQIIYFSLLFLIFFLSCKDFIKFYLHFLHLFSKLGKMKLHVELMLLWQY